MESPFKSTPIATLSPSKQHLSHGSALTANQRITSPKEPFAAMSNSDRTGIHNRNTFQGLYPTNQRHDERQLFGMTDASRADNKHQDRHPISDHTHLDPGRLRPHYRHKHSKSRDGRFPRTMSHIASSAGARGLLPTWSGNSKEKDRDGDDGLLRPITRETTRSRWESDSTGGVGSGSRRGSFLEGVEQNDRIGPTRQQEIRSPGDLEQVKNRRKQGEEYLRSALVSIGTLATDITRRLDYTYYNLLEKITALNTTITSFQGLADSTSTMSNDFEREVASMDQDIRKPVGELKEFQPQLERIEALEERMRLSREQAEALESRLENMRGDIDRWEKREAEWQTRVSRRLRILWGVVLTATLALVVAMVIQNWPIIDSSFNKPEVHLQATASANESSTVQLHQRDSTGSDGQKDTLLRSRYSSEPAQQANWQSASAQNVGDPDPLMVFDEL